MGKKTEASDNMPAQKKIDEYVNKLIEEIKKNPELKLLAERLATENPEVDVKKATRAIMKAFKEKLPG